MRNADIIHITPEGYEQLKRQLHELGVKLREISRSKSEAAVVGGNSWHDNFSFEQLVREEQALMHQISQIRAMMDRAEIVKPPDDPTEVQVGVFVEIEEVIDDSKKVSRIMKIVGPTEADPQNGLVSYLSPIGNALLGAKVGDRCPFHAPRGHIRQLIVKRIWKGETARHPFIVLEGLNGVGKTTVGKLLAERLGGEYYRTPPPPFDQIRERIDSSGDPIVRYYFYLSSVCYASIQIGQKRRKTPVVCDRYILTTQCYHSVLGISVVNTDSLQLEKPDLTVLLTCREPERQVRLSQRGRTHNDLEEERMGIASAFEREYRLSPEIFEVDTTDMAPKEVVNAILKQLSINSESQRK